MNKLEEAIHEIENSARKGSKGAAWECANKAAIIAGVIAHKNADNNFPDLERLERDVRSVLGNQKVIITRHAGLLEWLKAHGIEATVVTGNATVEDVKGKDVYGILPLWLAAEANSVTEVSMPGLPLEMRGKEYCAAQMDEWGAHMVRFTVRKEAE